MSTFYQRLYHRKCQPRGVGGQKSYNLVNVVCERSPRLTPATTTTALLCEHNHVSVHTLKKVSIKKFIISRSTLEIHQKQLQGVLG